MIYSRKSKFNSYFTYTFITLILVNIVVISALFILLIRQAGDRQMIFNRESQEREVFTDKSIIHNFLDETALDLTILKQTIQSTDLYITAAKGVTDKNDFTKLVTEFFNNKPKYFQFRIIDLKGMETYRIQRKEGHLVKAAVEILEDKSASNYFQETAKLDSGKFYASPLELNIDNGKIERPFRPVIRICTPMFIGGIKTGICVLKIDCTSLIEKIKKHTSSIPGIQYLINKEGYFIAAQDTSFEWGFMFPIKKNNTIEYLFPKIFRQIQSSVKDQFLTNNELVTISTVFPFQSGEIENNDPIIANDFSWKIISILPVKNFILTSLVTFNRFTVFYLLFLLTGCVVSYIFARSRAQRVKTRNQITESEAIMNLSLSHSDIGIWDLNLVSRKLVYHKSWYKMLGYDERETFPSVELFNRLIHPDDQPKAEKAFSEYISGISGNYEIAYRLLTISGDWKWVLDRGKIVKSDDNGKPVRVIGMQIDIDKQKRAENELFEYESKLKTLFDNLVIGIYQTAPDGTIMEVNQALCDILGYASPDQLKKINLENEFHADYNRRSFLDEISQKGIIEGKKAQWTRQDGEKIVVSESARAIKNINGDILYYLGTIEDISAHHQAEEKIKESEARYSNLYNSMIDGVVRTDLQGNILECNNSYLEMLGDYSDDEIRRLTYQQLTPVSWNAFEEGVIVPQIYSRGYSDEYEKEYIRKDGTIFPVSLRARLIHDKEGQPSGLWAIVRDITKRKNAEYALKESESKYRIIFVNNPNPMFIYDLESLAFLEVNQAAVDLYGYSREEFLTMTILDIRPEEDQKLVVENIRRIDSNEENLQSRNTWRHLKKNGELMFVEVSANSLNILGRNARHVLINDITQRKMLEEAILSKSSLLEAQLNSVSEGILIVDEQNLRILNNERYVEIFNIPEHFLEDTNHNVILNFVAGLTKEPDLFLEKVIYLNNHKKEKSHDQLELKNGHYIERYSAPVLSKNGVYYGRIWSFRDITELKNAELEIKLKNAELQKVIADKDKFYSIIAHDLRGPIGGIAGMTEMMADPTQYFSEEESKELIRELSESARNSFKLLEQLLEWSRMGNGLTEFKPQTLALKDVVTESLKPVSKSAQTKDIQVIVDISNKIQVFADLNMLQTIIRNLISNAIKFTVPGGSVRVSCQHKEGNRAFITVQDTGIGMTKEMVNNLFRVDVNTKRPGTRGEQSTGLGLLLCKEFVEAHDGKLLVESEVGKGSEFIFTVLFDGFNQGVSIPEIIVSQDNKSLHQNDLKILIAEDDMVSGKLIAAMVKRLCKEVLIVRTGQEVIDLCRLNPDIDVILMDISMPEVDGYEATRQIRRFNKDVIIIAQTALALRSDIEDALTAGCNDHIAKPIDSNELLRLIKKYL